MDISTLLQEIEAKRQNAWRGYLFSGLMGIAIIAMLLLRKASAAAIVTILWALYHFFLVLPDIRRFRLAFHQGNLLAAFSAQMDKVEYHGKAGIPQEKLRKDRLLPVREGGSCMTFHRVTGSTGGMTLELSEVSFQMEGPDSKESPSFFTGCWVRVELDHFTWRNLRLVSKDLLSGAGPSQWFRETANLTPREPEDSRIRKGFSLWEGEGDPGLDDLVLGHLADLREKNNTPLAMGLEGDRLTFFLFRRFLFPEDPSIRRPVSEAALRRSPLPELEGLVQIAAACCQLEVPEAGGSQME